VYSLDAHHWFSSKRDLRRWHKAQQKLQTGVTSPSARQGEGLAQRVEKWQRRVGVETLVESSREQPVNAGTARNRLGAPLYAMPNIVRNAVIVQKRRGGKIVEEREQTVTTRGWKDF
jgi:hypothetical protein